MDIFDLDRSLIGDYSQFARSFAEIRAPDIRRRVAAIYERGQFWPDPLISINPYFERGPSIDELVKDGTLAPETGKVFRSGGEALRLHRHQGQALSKAAAGQSFVVTTGTGSGKSLCFFIPIVDRAIRARLAGEAPRTKAIIIYPMNALANSQMEELKKYIDQSGLPEELRPTFARYTGQESRDERDRIRAEKPDILLTNFMMLELLMTRQGGNDRDVIAAATGVDFLVLDELHTYRGRQGADVAMLVRRVRDRLCRGKAPICIGTSATMASEGGESQRKGAVAGVATRLFGTSIGPDAVIDESLRRATDAALKPASLGHLLADAIDEEIPSVLTDEQLVRHPLAVWIEMEIGLEDGQVLRRRTPCTITDAASRLAQASGRGEERCADQLQRMLTIMSQPAGERGGAGDRAFMAFKLHRFISGAGFVYSTLRPPEVRNVTLEGQQFDPDDPEARLYSTHFCRSCGQEYHPVSLQDVDGIRTTLPRSIDDTPLEEEEGTRGGYLAPFDESDEEFAFRGQPEDYPEEWTDSTPSGQRLKSAHRRDVPERVRVGVDGQLGAAGREFWFIPGKFKFCLCCKDQPAVQARELTKLGGLSGEGRSSATTLLVSSALRWMNRRGSAIDEDKRKLLSFTDNRQDAALQAGHFNDTLFVTLLRGATLAAVRGAAAAGGLTQDQFGPAVQRALGFIPENVGRRVEWMLYPASKGAGPNEASSALSRVLAYRLWSDQRRGWRYTNPNLEETGLIRADYLSLDELAADEAEFASASDVLRNADATTREEALRRLLDALRGGLAISAEVLEPTSLDACANASRQALRDPWAIGPLERPRVAAALMIDAPKRHETKAQDEVLIIRGGSRSALARRLQRSDLWGRRLTGKEYVEVVHALLAAAKNYGLVRTVSTTFGVDGWQLVAGALRLVAADARSDGKRVNPYFVSLYTTIADALERGGDGLFGMEGREHTAQVEAERREWREWRFRWGAEDQQNINDNRDRLLGAGEPDDFLPVLFCSPTMELGVDISAMNAVYLRNVPPTPANYAQRSGRAGRSGQAALVVTYCAAQSPHDQYYFARPAEMVQGIVRPPALDIANRELVEAHLHAVWLAEAGTDLSGDIPQILDLHSPGLPVTREIEDALTMPELAGAASAAMARVLNSISGELTAEAAPWAQDRAALAQEIAARAFPRFTEAFRRWRTLYEGAREQMAQADARLQTPGLSGKDRAQAKALYGQAVDQIDLLERGGTSGGSDFYSYRYLATEGFLPGYNFPRLPLYAFVPASGFKGSKGAFLQRARFLAISEFGPGSLIYHEGRAYRVTRARLPAGLRGGDAAGRLTTRPLFVCNSCGASHDREVERCHACNSPMATALAIRDVLRIENVETQAQERITANDEERQRRGFEIQTMFEWPRRDGVLDVRSAEAADPDGPILHVDYSPGALISRVNKGLRRRKEKSILGFEIDPATGKWVKDPDQNGNDGPDGSITQRVVPIVEDRKNAALIRLATDALSDEGMATLQHALTRGLDIVYQLEESEMLSEPTPTRENRRAILSIEATEGGAGVLSRLISEPSSFARVAREALRLMHYTNIDAAVQSGDPNDLGEDEHVSCVKGCYRCLLSYFNQPDHELIDRTNEDVLRILLRLARSEVRPVETAAQRGGSWGEAFTRWGLPAPDATPLDVAGAEVTFAWRHLLVAATRGAPSPEVAGALEAKGFSVVALPDEPGEEPPAELRELLGETA